VISDVVDIELIFDLDFGDVGGLSDLLELGGSLSLTRFFLSGSGLFPFLAGHLGSCKHLNLGALLSLNELSLGALGLGLILLLLGLFFFLASRSLLLPVGLLVVLGALEPINELLGESTHGFAGAQVGELRVPVQLDFPAVPADEELVLDERVVVELLAQRRCELLLVRVLVHEELDHRLEQVLLTIVGVRLGKDREDWLVSIPRLHDVALGSENGTHAQVEFIFRRHVQLELELAGLAEDGVAVGGARRQLLIHERLQLADCVFDGRVFELEDDRVESVNLTASFQEVFDAVLRLLFLLLLVVGFFGGSSSGTAPLFALFGLCANIGGIGVRRSDRWADLFGRAELRVGLVVGGNVLVELLSRLMERVHRRVSRTARAADTD